MGELMEFSLALPLGGLLVVGAGKYGRLSLADAWKPSSFSGKWCRKVSRYGRFRTKHVIGPLGDSELPYCRANHVLGKFDAPK